MAHGEAEESKVYPRSSARTRSTRRRPSTGRRSTTRATRRCCRCSRRPSCTTRLQQRLHEFSETLLHHLDEEERDILNPAREDVSDEDRATARCRLARRAQPDARRGLRQPGAGARARRQLREDLLLTSWIADTRPLRNRALPAALDRQHRHGRRRPAHRGGGAGTDLRGDRLLGVRRPHRRLRPGPARRLRARGAAPSPTSSTGARC